VHGRPLALGISSPGIVDLASGRVTSLAYNVAPEGGFDPLEVIRDRFDVPVLVENNVNLAAVGEKWFGLARGVSTMVFIAIGAGNPAAHSVVEHVASRLGTAIATVCAILDPGLVVLGGGIGASPLLLSRVRGSAAALVPITARIETSLLGERAALQGAIAVALHAARATLLPRGAASKPHENVVAMP